MYYACARKSKLSHSMIKEERTDEVYAYIQQLKRATGVNYNFLNDSILSTELNKTVHSFEQISAICQIRYWLNVVALDNLKVVQSLDPGCCETVLETNMSYMTSKHTVYGKERYLKNTHGYQFGIKKELFNKFKVLAFNETLMSSCTEIKQNINNIKVLYIGARSEAEIFCMSRWGINIANVTGLDLYSYSDFIKVGDMHCMPFNANQFDLVLLTHCIGYSDNPLQVFDEVYRVLKPGGYAMVTQSIMHKQSSKMKNHLQVKGNESSRPRPGSKRIYESSEYINLLRANPMFSNLIAHRENIADMMSIFIIQTKPNS